jgi:hypothetical protein
MEATDSEPKITNGPGEFLRERDALIHEVTALCERINALSASVRDRESTAQVRRIISGYSADLEAHEERYADLVDTVRNRHTGDLVSWTTNVWWPDHHFTWDEEKNIVAEFPRSVLWTCTDYRDEKGHHLKKGLFLGSPGWSNILHVYAAAGEPIPDYTAALLCACEKGTLRSFRYETKHAL